MLVGLLSFVGGLALLLGAAQWLVNGAARLGERAGVPATVVGMVVVGFGTSLPELFVSLSAAFQGSASIAITNVVGSNVANVGLLLGLGVLVAPLTVAPGIVTREIPMLVLASVAFAVVSLDSVFGGGPNALARADGIVLLLFFAVFVYYTVETAVRRSRDRFLEQAADQAPPPTGSAMREAAQTVLGLAGVGLGAHLLVSGAVSIAADIGIPEAVVGLTVVSLGTSLPELAATVVAARVRQHDLAVGCIVGSNIFNTLLIGGTAALLAPSPMPDGALVDVLVMNGFALVLLPMALTGQRTLSRAEGALLVAGYAAFMGLVVVGRVLN